VGPSTGHRFGGNANPLDCKIEATGRTSSTIITAPMDSPDITRLAAELQRRAEEKLGHERAEALRADVTQLAGELDALRAFDVPFEDEP
jgi:hypothetical protein